MLKRKKQLYKYDLQEMLHERGDRAGFFMCYYLCKKVCVCVCVREREREREKADYFFEITHKKLGAMVGWVCM